MSELVSALTQNQQTGYQQVWKIPRKIISTNTRIVLNKKNKKNYYLLDIKYTFSNKNVVNFFESHGSLLH